MKKGTTIGNEKIAALFDSGTFVETGAYLKRANGDPAGVICGYGAIGGKLVYAFSQDSDRNKGAFDALQAEKIVALYNMATKNGAPVIGIFDSIGAVIADGSTVMSAYGKVLAAVSAASGVIPQIALISGICSGLSATIAAMFDLTVTVKEQSRLFVNAPFLIGKEIGSAEYAAETGLASVCTESMEEAEELIKKLVARLPSNNEEGVVADELTDDINRTSNIEGLSGKALIAELADAGEVIEIGSGYAKEMVTAIITLGGVTCGVVANDQAVNGGVITCEGAKKAAKLVGLCDSFSIPVITLTDSIGVESSKTAEGAALALQLGKLAMAYATADTAKITAVVGKAYGAAFTLMGSKALGADMVYATPESSVSVMAPASAVAFLWNDRITEDTTRADLEDEWNRECASPEAAAADGSIDDVVDAKELRQRICSAVYMLMMKNSGTPARKHCNLPL